jgi:hypothetical protein
MPEEETFDGRHKCEIAPQRDALFRPSMQEINISQLQPCGGDPTSGRQALRAAMWPTEGCASASGAAERVGKAAAAHDHMTL